MKKAKTTGGMRELIFQNFDNFETACKRTAKKWETEALSLKFLKMALGIIKWEPKKKADGKTKKLAETYNETLNSMYAVFEGMASDMGTTNVSLDFIAKVIENVKKSFDSVK